MLGVFVGVLLLAKLRIQDLETGGGTLLRRWDTNNIGLRNGGRGEIWLERTTTLGVETRQSIGLGRRDVESIWRSM
jgi:hypothetical protein